jgi:hypothetical protein
VWAAVFPAQIDTFMAVGELALFVALADRWPPRSRLAAWLVTLAGLAVSIAGNVGHVTGGSLADRATWAVPPVAAAAALAVGLGVLKRVVEAHHQAVSDGGKSSPPGGEFLPPGSTTAAVPAAVPIPSVREIRATYQCSQGTAQKIRKAIRAHTAPTDPPAGRALTPRSAMTSAGVSPNGQDPK